MRYECVWLILAATFRALNARTQLIATQNTSIISCVGGLSLHMPTACLLVLRPVVFSSRA